MSVYSYLPYCRKCQSSNCGHLGQRCFELTRRQLTLASLVYRHLSNKQIALALGLQESSVKVYLSTIYKKIGLDSRLKLALWFYHTFVVPGLHKDGSTQVQ